MCEIITNLSKVIQNNNEENIHKLSIETLKDNKPWTAYIAIHIPKNEYYTVGYISITPRFICDITLNFSTVNNYKKLIGRKIIKKEQVQFNEHTEGTSKYSTSHMTKLIFYLEKLQNETDLSYIDLNPNIEPDEIELFKDYDILSMRIGDIYDTRKNNGFQHTGGDSF